MNLIDILKQFKNIEPDPAFAERSRRAILATEPKVPAWSARQTLLRIVETGIAVALTGFFILLLTGALSNSRIAPVQYSAINPASLHAEAQAIDMQIELAQLNYTESSAESTPSAAPAKGSAAAGNGAPASAAAGAASSASGTATSSATTTVSIDQALQSLSN